MSISQELFPGQMCKISWFRDLFVSGGWGWVVGLVSIYQIPFGFNISDTINHNNNGNRKSSIIPCNSPVITFLNFTILAPSYVNTLEYSFQELNISPHIQQDYIISLQSHESNNIMNEIHFCLTSACPALYDDWIVLYLRCSPLNSLFLAPSYSS